MYHHPLSTVQVRLHVPGRKVNILGGYSIGHSKQKSVYTCVLFETVSEIELFHCTVVIARIKERQDAVDEQNAMSSHEQQTSLMLTVEFSKIYYTR
jgi:hypothetical protein